MLFFFFSSDISAEMISKSVSNLIPQLNPHLDFFLMKLLILLKIMSFVRLII